MTDTVFFLLDRQLREVCETLLKEKAPGAQPPENLGWGPTRNPEHGDVATQAALSLAKPLRAKPMEIAERIRAAFENSPWFERIAVAAPGFVNATFTREALRRLLADPIEQGAEFGRTASGAGKPVLLEFVSANPTGPMHVGHARHAAVGDSLARLFSAAGWKVHREYYLNDAGNQVGTLGRSLRQRVLQLLGDSAPLADDGYPGDYLLWYAWDFLRQREPQLTAGVDEQTLFGGADPERFRALDAPITRAGEDSASPGDDSPARRQADAQRRWIEAVHALLARKAGEAALAAAREKVTALPDAELIEFGKTNIFKMIEKTLADLRCAFDRYFSESHLYRDGLTEATLQELEAAGAIYREEGAVWVRSSSRGDDKDRVLVKSDGSYTYLLPDIAYHRDKFRRRGGAFGETGPELLVNLFGSDHDGYAPRLKASLALLGHDPERLKIIIMRLVFLMRAGERLDMGKRSGNFVSARDLLDEAGCDVLRFFLLQRSVNSEINFDLDLARERSDRNPVYKIQYAHARVCSLFRRAAEKGLAWRGLDAGDALALTAPEERDLLREVAQLPATVEKCVRALDPQPMATYLLGLADLFNRYWSLAKVDPDYRMLDEAHPARTQARLSFAAAIRVALANGLRLLGVEAPERMEREEEAAEN